MTIQKDQTEQSMENPSDIAEKIAALGSMDAVKESGAFDELMGFIDRGEIQLDGKDGFIQQIIRAGLERGLKSELSSHLGYEKGESHGQFIANSRNGSYPKTVSTIGRGYRHADPPGPGRNLRPDAGAQGLAPHRWAG